MEKKHLQHRKNRLCRNKMGITGILDILMNIPKIHKKTFTFQVILILLNYFSDANNEIELFFRCR